VLEKGHLNVVVLLRLFFVLCAFVVLGLVSSDWLGQRLQNYLFCVECDLKPELSECVLSGT